MAAWTPDELDSLDRTDETRVAGSRKDGNGAPTQVLNRQPARGTTLRIDAA